MTLAPLSGGLTLDTLRERLARHGYVEVDEHTLDGVAARTAQLVLLPLDNPAQRPEFADLLVILPELLSQFGDDAFTVAYAGPPAAAALARRFGVLRQPALVFLHFGALAGTIEGLRDWREYVQAFARLCASAAPSGLAGASNDATGVRP
ncbi:hydrogenase [Paraburkholderia sp.]|jgi:hydrogenase-1 operon protein HyaE|uniref:hydrogenase n=1 Tax=Paraburkholderia sp. TaxID=1926495 RepID=UPI00286EC9BA|nr:hydrogenase [Paraburkholderia sp.]